MTSDKAAGSGALPEAPKALRADARRNRELLLVTARTLFAEGQGELRLDEVARRAGVGTGTLYRHFESREALIEAVYRQEIERLCASADALLTTKPADQALAAFLGHLVDYAADNRGLATALSTSLSGSPSTEAHSLSEPGPLLQALTRLLEAGALQKCLRADVDPVTVMVVMGSLCAAQDHPGWKPQAQAVVSLLLDGLRVQPQAGSVFLATGTESGV
ncbi:TetR/AcrR family transcriptional regulator [Deinococcus marmoris]|uniref:Transcriptional regulator, TetR family n=1 Tax=Deinococcus marmoris TaxID=249408 RepID=A0A1U7P134_9DEIO|nr:TetR/AcrR family transcriptional regulator [Deinococcus marmoris]OLV18879.1 Transcriptional regulator, TetR family [Deinococcus marmoris]